MHVHYLVEDNFHDVPLLPRSLLNTRYVVLLNGHENVRSVYVAVLVNGVRQLTITETCSVQPLTDPLEYDGRSGVGIRSQIDLVDTYSTQTTCCSTSEDA